MKTLNSIKVVLIFISALLLTTSATQALADQAGPYYATPSWDQQLPASTRFVVLSNWSGAAVLDRETGLVWEKTPSDIMMNWSDAHAFCIVKNLGGRTGWKLPSIQEIFSLIDMTQSPPLPAGHPFVIPSGAGYIWSATTLYDYPGYAWSPNVATGPVVKYITRYSKNSVIGTWCVRGGSGVDFQ